MMRYRQAIILSVALLIAGWAHNIHAHYGDLKVDPTTIPAPGDGIFKPFRTQPTRTGEFSVGVILIQFQEEPEPDVERIEQRTFYFHGMHTTDYFKEYTQNIMWPAPYILRDRDGKPLIYNPPHPLGYYCEFDHWANPIGFKDIGEGRERAENLRAEAGKFALKEAGRPKDIQTKGLNEPHVFYYIYCNEQNDQALIREKIQPHYQSFKEGIFLGDKFIEVEDFATTFYKPVVKWGDPLWPNSTPQQLSRDGGDTFCHELGHLLGQPDFYHGTEPYDGMPGVPCIPMVYGPCGPNYSRYIYSALIEDSHHPHFSESGEYTLYRRNLNPVGDKVVGCFIPSSHPHYFYVLEYVSKEKAPLGVSGAQGLLVSVVNCTLSSPFHGPPDLCYTYRANDPFCQGITPLTPRTALLSTRNGRDEFSMDSNPSSRLPNLVDGGMSFKILEETEDYVKFKLILSNEKLNGNEYTESLIPKVRLDSAGDALPTSFAAEVTVLFRGEPLKTEYGFCYGSRATPTIRDSVYPLYHRDRYRGRALGLQPGQKYYVRAYAKNEIGVSYSEQELTVTTPEFSDTIERVPPLSNDRIAIRMNDPLHYSAQCAFLKLAAYYRDEIIKSKRKLDYTRLHSSPDRNKPSARLSEVLALAEEYAPFVLENRLNDISFTEDFDKDFGKLFNLTVRKNDKYSSIQNLTEDNKNSFPPLIKRSLVQSIPVMAVQEFNYGEGAQPLHWILIDGMDGEKFHLSMTNPHDLTTIKTIGWYALDDLLEKATEVKLIFSIHKTVELKKD